MTKLLAIVKKCGHNREFVSLQMVEAEPHVMSFVGDGGREYFGEESNELIHELIRLGHKFEVETVYQEASMMEFC